MENEPVEVELKDVFTFSKSGMGLVEYLQYTSYRHHRQNHSNVKPEKWISIFEDQVKFEEVYQKELKGKK